MNPSHCAFDDRDEIAARYVAGQHAPDADDYELHLLSCGHCREAVKESASLRAALRMRKQRQRLALLAPVGLASAAVIAWLISRQVRLGSWAAFVLITA